MRTLVLSTILPFNRRLLGLTMGLSLLGTVAAQAQTVYGLNRASNLLVTSSFAAGGIPSSQPITGITAGQLLVGLDSRPATGELFALGYNGAGTGQLYTINKASGAATPVGGTLPLALGGITERIGFDFNPTVDRIRVVSSNDTNYRLNPNNGTIAATDGNLNFETTGPFNGQDPIIGAVAYRNSFIGAATTELYAIDESRSTLFRQNPPNAGTLANALPITRFSLPLLLATDQSDLDVYTDPSTGSQLALLAVTRGASTTIYILDLETGTASVLTSGAPGLTVDDIAFNIDRTAPAPSGQRLYAVNTNNALLSFDSGTPGFILTATGITGITAGQTLVGTDFRPNNGQLFGLGYDPTTAGANSQLYTIDLSTGVATSVAAAVRLELGAATDNIGFDFNPTVDRIRVVSTNRNNYRLNPSSGAIAAIDGPLTYAAGDANAGSTPRIGSAAYANSFAGATSTTLFGIDEALTNIVRQDPPNAGTLNTIGKLLGFTIAPTNALVDFDLYYDVASQTNRPFIAVNNNGAASSSLYTLVPNTLMTNGDKTATLAGTIGYGIPVRDIASLPDPASIPNDAANLTGRLLYGIAAGNLVSFDSGNPGIIRSAVNIVGLPVNGSQVLVGTDFRPATGELFALGYDATNQQGQLYTVDIASGILTAVGTLNALALGTTASAIGFDFNPTVDLIRVVSATNQANFRLNPTTGAVLTDTNLNNPAGAPAISASAYTNNDTNPATGTMLYGYDQTRNVLLLSSNANGGVYGDVGSSGITVNAAGVDFDIFADLTTPATPVNSAFLVAAPTGTTADILYTVNLANGSATSVGRIGVGSNLTGLAASIVQTVTGITWTGAVNTDWGTSGNWSPQQVPTGTDNVTIPDTANDPVVSNTQQANNVTLQSGATLTTANGGSLTVNGDFVNNGGTTAGAGTGEVIFAGAATQVISGTVTLFNNLTAGGGGSITAAGPVQVQRVLRLDGNLISNGNLTLLSNATGTAHVINGSGTVTGSTTVQRYIDPRANAGAGYRHYSSPVTASTVGDLGTAGFSPVVNPAYNTAPIPAAVTPFPTVFGYDETRVNTSGNPAPQDFDKGFFSPGSLGDVLEPGRGYTVNIPASQTVDFVGTLTNGSITRGSLTRGTQAESGWHLLGNPYPSPIDWDLVGRTSVGAAVYVFRSTGQYAGTYSSYVAGSGGTGTNGGTDQLAVAQGFFVRNSAAGSAGAVAFSNAARLTTYANPIFQRPATSNPLVRLDLRGATGSADETVVYFQPGATAGFDAALDAYKLVAGGTPMLATPAGAERLSISGLPALGTADVLVPLLVQAPQAGTYTLRATELLNLPAGTYAYLRDTQTGTVTDLAAQSSYSFALVPGAPMGRFSLQITRQRVLATASAALSQQVVVFPNPARGSVSISLPASLSKQPTSVMLVNSLGQTVLRATLPAATTEVRNLLLPGIAQGVYTLRLQTASGTVNKRLVIE